MGNTHTPTPTPTTTLGTKEIVVLGNEGFRCWGSSGDGSMVESLGESGQFSCWDVENDPFIRNL